MVSKCNIILSLSLFQPFALNMSTKVQLGEGYENLDCNNRKFREYKKETRIVKTKVWKTCGDGTSD